MKTNKEILDQEYINTEELQQLLRTNYKTALEYIREAQNIMTKKGYLVPKTKSKQALTSVIKKMFGI